MDPSRFMGKEVLVVTDNAAAVHILAKGYSTGDPWASCICRAARIIAAKLCCRLQAVWEPRRSSRGSVISDNLTHNLLFELSNNEVEAYLSQKSVEFPPPLLNWMANPYNDTTLGYKCWLWLSSSFKEMAFMK